MSGRTPDEGRYSKVSRRMWGDERFQALSAAKPNAQSLWQRLLTGPELGCIPGLYAARIGGLADALKWPLKATQKCWKEIADQGMAEADWSAGLVWVPNAIVHNEPQSTNTVIGWRLALRELPECELKRRALASIHEFLAKKGEAWAKALDEASGKPSPKPSAMASPKPSDKPSSKVSAKPSRIQEQEQDSRERDPKEKPASQDTVQVVAPARMGPPVLACGLQEAGASTRQERQRPTFGALNCEPPTTARAIEVPEVMKTYALELGLSENQYSDVLTDFREKVKDPQGAHRLMSLLFRFIEAKAKGSPSGPSVAPAVRLERERRAAAAEEERQRWQSEQEAQATKEAREQLLAVGIDPDRPSPEAIKNLMTGIGGG